MEKFHNPDKFQYMIMKYYSVFHKRSSVSNYVTHWQQLDVGIITGCTLLVILFSGAMNLLMKAVENRNRETTLAAGVKMPPIRGFMDDMIVACKTVLEAC